MEIFRLFGSVLLKDQEAQKGLDDIDKKGEKVGGRFSELTSKVGKFAVGLAAIGGAAVVGMFGKSLTAADEMKKSLNGIGAATGYGAEKMAGMRDAMLDIYNNNFGESFEDIGKQMTTIAQQTGASGEKLANLTKTAIAMRDTFEFEVNESIRSANMLVTQFGMSGDEAYNLIAQGAQKGLDKNGDLLDSVNEYSVHFKQLGIGAEGMFNMLVNGAASGTFSVDKLGDAVKEFGIRAKDGSDTTRQAYAAMNLDADKLTQAFAKGGESGKTAFELVTKSLLDMKDPVLQNQIGVALFGTMWEDLGTKGIQALTNMNGEISKTNDALKNINSVKYNSLTEALAGIGRNLQTGIMVPISENVLPKLNEMGSWITANMPQIQATIETAMNYVGGLFNVFGQSIQFVIDNSNILIPVLAGVTAAITAQFIINTINDLYKKWKAATEAQTAVQVILNAVMSANPFGIVALAIGALVAAGIALYKNWDTVSAFLSKTWGMIKNTAVNVFNNIVDFFKKWGPQILAILTGPIGLLVLLFVKNFDKIKETALKVFGAIGSFIGGIVDGIKNGFKGMVNGVISALNFMIGALNKLHFEIPDWVPQIGGKGFGFNIPEIPMLAEGGSISKAGRVLVGERGPEFLDLPEGAKVTPLDKADKTQTIYNNINIDKMEVRDDKDIESVAEELNVKQKKRGKALGGVLA